MPIVFESEYHLVEYLEDRDLLILHRSAIAMPGPQETIEAFERLFLAVHRYAGRPLLIDIRRVQGNNATRYETAIKPCLARLRDLFPLNARLVQTAAGRLQVQRLARERGESAGTIFSDEEEALAYLELNRPAK